LWGCGGSGETEGNRVERGLKESGLGGNFGISLVERRSPLGFTKPTGPVNPPPSGSGLPDRFDWKPVETG